MGLFSWNCKKCSHSIKSPFNVPSGWEYMTEAVVLREGEEPVIGENSGKPNRYTGGSEYSQDQGFFYDEPTEEEWDEALGASE